MTAVNGIDAVIAGPFSNEGNAAVAEPIVNRGTQLLLRPLLMRRRIAAAVQLIDRGTD